MQLRASLRRRARIEENLIVHPGLVDWHMAVPEDDEIGIWKPTMQASGAALRGATVVDECATDPFKIEDPALGECSHQVVIVVSENGVRLSHGLEFYERLR